MKAEKAAAAAGRLQCAVLCVHAAGDDLVALMRATHTGSGVSEMN